MKATDVEFTILVNNKPIKEYNLNNDIFVEAFKKGAFSIKIKNTNLFHQVLAVISVDGLSVNDGKPASEKSPGYVINGGQTIIVAGWRKDDDNVAQFMFDVAQNGYASKTNQKGNEGVIGLMTFAEKSYNFSNYPVNIQGATNRPSYSAKNNYASMSLSSTPSVKTPRRIDATEKLAVGHGDNVSHSVSQVTFNRAETPTEIIAIQYDSRIGLERRGIIISPTDAPNPFPASTQGCPEPNGGW